MIQIFKTNHPEALKQQVMTWLEMKTFKDESQILGIQHFTVEDEVGLLLRYEEK